MTGPDHYREAERLLADPANSPSIALAHATLALVAATAPRGSGEWQAVVSPTKDEEVVS